MCDSAGLYNIFNVGTYKENTGRGEVNLIASSELSNVQFNALIRVRVHEVVGLYDSVCRRDHV